MRRETERSPPRGRRRRALRLAMGGLLVFLVTLAALVGLDLILDAIEGESGEAPPRWVLHGEECLAIYGPGEAPSVCLARGVRTRHGGTNGQGLWGGEFLGPRGEEIAPRALAPAILEAARAVGREVAARRLRGVPSRPWAG